MSARVARSKLVGIGRAPREEDTMVRDTAGKGGAIGELEVRLRVLGRLLDRRGYTAEGLCLIEVDGGFVATGLRVPERGAAYALAQETLEVGPADLAAEVAALAAAPARTSR
jgi:hypothetical protein